MFPDGKERLEVSSKLQARINTANGSVTGRNQTEEKPDAGLRSLDHCELFPCKQRPSWVSVNAHVDKTKLPSWRYKPRQSLIPLVRWETPRLATMQRAMRSPALDSYFSITASLGTHTFFMVFLPILFWCGYTAVGRGYDFRNHLLL